MTEIRLPFKAGAIWTSRIGVNLTPYPKLLAPKKGQSLTAPARRKNDAIFDRWYLSNALRIAFETRDGHNFMLLLGIFESGGQVSPADAAYMDSYLFDGEVWDSTDGAGLEGEE